MDETIYTQEREKLLSQINKPNQNPNELLVKDGRFNLIAANIMQIMPQSNFDYHKEIFKNITLFQKLSRLDQFYANSIENCELLGFTDSIKNSIQKTPFIFTTFHLGSYRLINHFLIKQGISFDLLIAKNTYEREGNIFEVIYNKNKIDEHQKIGLIDAENSSAIFSMLRCLKNGRSLLIYMDGNTGIGSNSKNNINLSLTKLGDGEILARKGAMEISFLTNIPIINILSFVENSRTKLKFYPIINFNEGTKEEYANYALSEIYKQFETLLLKYPDQWEGWFYIHKSLCVKNRHASDNQPDKISYRNKYLFNYFDYGIFKIKEKYYLFNKNNLLSYNIDINLFVKLFRSINIKQSFTEFNIETIQNLLKEKVIY